MKYLCPCKNGGHSGCDCMVVGLTIPVQSVPITTNVVSSNPVHGATTLCDKVVSNLRQISGFLWFPPPIKLTTTI